MGSSGEKSYVANDGTSVFYLADAIHAHLRDVTHQMQAQESGGMSMFVHDVATNAAPYHDAAWSLVGRGILRPAPLSDQANISLIGTVFMITEYGRAWLERTTDLLPTEIGGIGQLLAARATRLGAGYVARSQEAVTCYQAHAYLACCTMCGGAAESTTLALAIARTIARGDDEASVLATYRRNTGRTAIERLLMAGRNGHVQQTLPTFLSLLNYWRDEAAHGMRSDITEDDAHVALLLLLRYAIFADSRWEELTGP